MKSKKCFKCHKVKPLSEFYKHKMMGDGHLGKCKVCTRRDTAERVAIKSATDLDWVLAERKRCRLKSKKRKMTANEATQKTAKYRSKFPAKARAHSATWNALNGAKITKQPCEVCGKKKVQAHHDDYSKPLEVRWLCAKHHAEHHVKMRDQEIINRFKSA